MSSRQTAGPAYRADVDGLRAIAVLCVIGFHAAPRSMPGGFIGVDVFFVISGFLICGLIFKGLRDGSFTLADFFARRIRRLFPALIVLFASVWTIGWFVLLPQDFVALGKHIVAGAGFSANILNYVESGYFDAPASSKPLLHLWSLGVEEQFYVIFPLIIVALWWRPRAALAVLGLIALVSFGFNIWQVGHDPPAAFYLPFARMWEFILGGALAVVRPLTLPAVARHSASAAGLVMILMGAVLLHGQAYPGWRALIPAVGTVLIIGAGPEAFLNRHLLANRRIVFLGLISYPLYLWHWPLLVFARQLGVGHDVRYSTVFVLAAAFVLSVLTYQLVERPIRAEKSRKRVVTGLLAGMIVVAAIGFLPFYDNGILGRYPKAVRSLLVPLQFQTDFSDMAEAAKHPGPALAFMGDSHADHLYPGLKQLQRERDFRIYGVSGWPAPCAPLGIPPPGQEEECREKTRLQIERLKEIKPDVVIVAAFWWQYPNVAALEGLLASIRDVGVKKIVVLGDVPFWQKPPQKILYDRFASTGGIPDRLTEYNRETPEVDKRVKAIADRSGAIYVSLFDILCNEEGCLVRLGDSAPDIIQTDLNHLSHKGSSFIVKSIERQLFD